MDARTFLHRLSHRDDAAAESARVGARFLGAADMQRLRQLEFSTVRRVRGALSGRHSSRQRGQSVEFNDYRQYMPGDDPADVDWKAYGRSDRLYIKLYEHESELSTTILVDGSASMDFRGCDAPPPGTRRVTARGETVSAAGPSKIELAGSIAAALGFLLVQRSDRVALGIAAKGTARVDRPGVSMAHLQEMLSALDGHACAGDAALPAAIEAAARRSRRRGILVVISDFLDDPDATVAALAEASARGHEPILFQTMHAEELDLPRGGAGLFVDSESGERVRVHLDDIRQDYMRVMAEFLERFDRMTRSLGIDRTLIHTGEDRFEALARYLQRRGGSAGPLSRGAR
jgi:uncharacterized protein (DUF58 family)